jgi:hypothetical protein
MRANAALCGVFPAEYEGPVLPIFIGVRLDVEALGAPLMEHSHQFIEWILVGLHQGLEYLTSPRDIDQPVQGEEFSRRSGEAVGFSYLLPVQNLDCHHASWPQDLKHLTDYFLPPGPRNVIEHDAAVDQIEAAAGCGQWRQAGGEFRICDAAQIAIAFSLGQIIVAYINADDGTETPRERQDQAANATSEIKRVIHRQLVIRMELGAAQNFIDVAFTAVEKFFQGSFVEILCAEAFGTEDAIVGIILAKLPPRCIGIVKEPHFVTGMARGPARHFLHLKLL